MTTTSAVFFPSTGDMKGYLVVLKQPVRWAEANRNYKGLYRGPGWPSRFPEEEEAVDAYIWGPYMDESQGGLIPTEDLARELYHRFDASPREFDIIYASTPDEGEGTRLLQAAGL